MSEPGWLPIDDPSCPRDGTPVDLWIEGPNTAGSMVDFYSLTAARVIGKPLRHGRAADFRWEQRGINPPNWYPLGGLGYPLSPEATPTHFRRHTAPTTPAAS